MMTLTRVGSGLPASATERPTAKLSVELEKAKVSASAHGNVGTATNAAASCSPHREASSNANGGSEEKLNNSPLTGCANRSSAACRCNRVGRCRRLFHGRAGHLIQPISRNRAAERQAMHSQLMSPAALRREPQSARVRRAFLHSPFGPRRLAGAPKINALARQSLRIGGEWKLDRAALRPLLILPRCHVRNVNLVHRAARKLIRERTHRVGIQREGRAIPTSPNRGDAANTPSFPSVVVVRNFRHPICARAPQCASGQSRCSVLFRRFSVGKISTSRASRRQLLPASRCTIFNSPCTGTSSGAVVYDGPAADDAVYVIPPSVE